MVSIPAATADEYLASLPPDRRAVVDAVRSMVRRHLPAGYEERPMWGMLTYAVPLSASGPTYNGQPLCYAAIAAQKQHFSLYLMGPYGDPALRRRLEDVFREAGKKLDMGKSCVRFKSLDAIPLEAMGPIIAAVPMAKYIEFCARVHAGTRTGSKAKAKARKSPPKRAARKATARKAATKATAKRAAKAASARRR